jgi:hypothetical protein
MKASGSSVSLMQGVSQQVPQDRGPGQHSEQINMIPDPVQGLARRHGSRFIAELATVLSPASIAAYTADTANWRTFEYSNAGHDYVLLVRSATRDAGAATLPAVLVYDRTVGAFLPAVRNAVDAQLDLLESGGVSGIAAIGKYVFMSGFTTQTTAASVDLLNAGTNPNDAVVWVRGGAYARTYTVSATRTDGTQFTFSATTPTSSYPGTLDTSGVPVYAADPAGGTIADTESAYIVQAAGPVYRAELSWFAWSPTALTAKKGGVAMTNTYPAAPTTTSQFSWNTGDRYAIFAAGNLGALDVSMTYTHTKTVPNPNYAKSVTDLTNAFNTAVTNWIGTAAAAIQPAAIAEQLRLAAVTAGLATATRQASTVIFDNVKALSVNDGGDATLIRGVSNEVTAADEVSTIHKIGKVVKVRAKNAAEAYYLRAESKSAGIVSGYTEVTWVEGAGTQHTITNALCYLTVEAGVPYIASSAALLTAIAGGTHPTYSQSTVGDANSSPLPFFIGKQITYLGVFQDRLMIGAGAVLRASKIGDYLNLFRSSVLTAPADDPLEMLSQGSEDDTLRYSTIYDRDLVVFGDKRQYAISGRVALTPTSANMQVMSAHANAAQLPPLAVGGVIFYGQLGEKSSSVHQIQPGQVAESPESFIQSSQIDTYLSGNIIELANNAKPTHLFARTTAMRNSIYCFTYLDKTQQGRVQDAWHRFDYDAVLGPIIGMSRTPAGLMIYSMRVAPDFAGVPRVYLVADLQSMTTSLALTPYLDSYRPLTAVNANTGSLHSASIGPYRVAFDSTSEWQFVGSDLTDQASLLAEFPAATGPQVGADMTTAFVPTNPYMRDRNDKAVTSGNLTVTAIRVSIAKSSGFWADVQRANRREP